MRNKFGAVRTVVDGINFASKAEARRYSELKLLERAGAITGLELQKRYKLSAVGGEKIAAYLADFDYIETQTGERVTEDVKGVLTPVFKLKAKLFEAQYGRKIKLIT